MAINVDTVYQTVQALANKEQRGYITPQEFNLFANQAQNDIFDQYIYDLQAFKERRPFQRDLGDSVTGILKKLDEMGVYTPDATVSSCTDLPDGFIGEIYLGHGGTRRTLKKVDPNMVHDLNSSIFHKRGWTDAVYFDEGFKHIQVWDNSGQINTGCTCEQVNGRPGLVIWGYTVVNEKPLWNPTTSSNFDLPAEESSDLIIKILKLAGISIEDQQLFSAGAAEDGLNTQQENK